jgi:hypothetical protein
VSSAASLPDLASIGIVHPPKRGRGRVARKRQGFRLTGRSHQRHVHKGRVRRSG